MALTVGQTTLLSGNVTQLKAFGAKAPGGVEEMLGYHKGRLAAGYWICLLLDALTPADFEFEGNTLRSGGRLGAPALTQNQDAARMRVHDKIMGEYSAAEFTRLQVASLRSVTLKGENRIAKVVPNAPHAAYASPAFQYPMGGGSLQWRLKPPGKRFFVAAFVNAQGRAETPGFVVTIAANGRYDDRARLRSYLDTAPYPGAAGIAP